MVVYHAGGLHEGVANGAADKFEAAGEEGFAHGVGFGGAGWDFGHGFELMDDRFASAELPEEVVEGSEFFLHFYGGAGVRDGELHFEAVADNAGVIKEFLYFGWSVAGDFLDIEIVEGGTIVFALFEDGGPA